MRDWKAEVDLLIEKHGAEAAIQPALDIMSELIQKSKLKRSLGDKAQFMINTGMENVDAVGIETMVERAIKCLPDGDVKQSAQSTFQFWKDNRANILQDNRIQNP